MRNEYFSRSDSGRLICRRLDSQVDIDFTAKLIYEAQLQANPSWINEDGQIIVDRNAIEGNLRRLIQEPKSIFYYENIYGAFDWGNAYIPLGLIIVIDEETPLDYKAYPPELLSIVSQLVEDRKQLPADALLLTNLYVQRAKRQQSIGDDLIWHFCQQLRGSGYKHLYFTCPSSSRSVQEVLEQNGYTKTLPLSELSKDAGHVALMREIDQ